MGWILRQRGVIVHCQEMTDSVCVATHDRGLIEPNGVLFCESREQSWVLALPTSNSKASKAVAFRVVSMCDMPGTLLCF